MALPGEAGLRQAGSDALKQAGADWESRARCIGSTF